VARPKIKKGQKTVPLVTHIPVDFKKKVVAAAKTRDVTIAQFVRSSLERVVRA
jgi:hypothetical protein